jgi:hypothetical protein
MVSKYFNNFHFYIYRHKLVYKIYNNVCYHISSQYYYINYIYLPSVTTHIAKISAQFVSKYAVKFVYKFKPN